MKKYILSLLLGLATTASAEVKISYSPEIPNNQKSGLEQKIKIIAGKYMKQPYADLGPCDFLGKDDIKVHVIPFEKLNSPFNFGEDNGDGYDYETNTVQIQNQPSPLFEHSLIHEIAHAYDYNKNKGIFDRIKNESIGAEESADYKNIEGRACKKEYFFLNEIKNRTPKHIYNALMNVKFKYNKEKNDLVKWYKIYNKRGLINAKWFYEELKKKK